MSTPSEPPYAPPYDSAPAYSQPAWTGGYDGLPYGEPPPPPPPPAPPVPTQRRRLRGPALLLAACLASGAVGGVAATAFDDDPVTTGASGVAITQGTAAPAVAGAGTTQAAAATLSPSVVTIAVTGTATSTDSFGQSGSQPVSGTGSGIVLRPDGFIVTNNHVVSAAVNGGTVSVTFSTGSTTPARIVGTDPTTDLAVLKVDGQSGLTAAVFGDSDKLVVGQPVIAIGAPLGLANTVTEGIVSTLRRPVRTGENPSEQAVLDAVQTDAAINPGNSGGALADLAGKVVGINSAIASTGGGDTAGNIGVGFAIPSNDVVEVADALIANGSASHPVIGISAADAPSATDGIPGRGATVQSVTAGGPAASAGLQQGDIITKIGDRAVTDADSLIVSVREYDPGNTVSVTYLRGGATATVQATLVKAPPR